MTAIGHLSTGLFIKGRFPRAPLPLLLFAAALPDVLWVAFNLLRTPAQAPLEIVRVDVPFNYIGNQHLLLQPISHALASTVVLALGVSLLVFMAYRERAVAFAVGAAVVGHWVLDFLVHDADLTLWPTNTARPVGPPFVFDAFAPSHGLFTTRPLLGYALQTLLVLACTMVFLRANPLAGKVGRRKMWAGVLVLCAAALPMFIHGASTKLMTGSSSLLIGAMLEMVVIGWALKWLASWAVGNTPGALDAPHAEPFVHRLLTTAGVGCLVIAAVYLLQSMIDAQTSPRIGATSILMALLYVEAGRRFYKKNPSTLWFAAFLGFVLGPVIRVYTDAGRLGPTLLVLELALAFSSVFLMRTLLRRNLSL
ncbi:MAG: hypothetical protein SF187_22275 [Deltaproteobacteria bacterium]|nr:hypothetical protein [Deltaproteobacteria bacterium]